MGCIPTLERGNDYLYKMNQPNYLDVPTEFPPDCAVAYGQDIKGYWLELSFFNQIVRFRWIPSGQFTMGSDEKEKGRYDWEDQHLVILSKGFWLAETTVTQALWQAVMGKNPSEFQEGETSNFLVESVSWNEAKKFIGKLNQLHSDIEVRLPWEAEWEYACRAGTETSFSFEGELTLDEVNSSGTWDGIEWNEKAKKTTTVVKSYPSNAWGLYEMHGNVWEWCEDSWQENLGTEEVKDPWLIAEKRQAEPEVVGVHRVLRGGSWFRYGRDVRSAVRVRGESGLRRNFIGFRLSLGL